MSDWSKVTRRYVACHAYTHLARDTDDVSLPGRAYAAMVRSPHAHARILRINTAPALATPGMLAVLTSADLVVDGLGVILTRPNSARGRQAGLPR